MDFPEVRREGTVTAQGVEMSPYNREVSVAMWGLLDRVLDALLDGDVGIISTPFGMRIRLRDIQPRVKDHLTELSTGAWPGGVS